MSTSNTALKVADLDFTSIKQNLKDFLKSQSEFTDYDFEGSGMSVLLDLLAYNTYYNGFYLNMVANESFLDTAQIRKNVLSHAKLINYVPKSAEGALAKINITITPTETENQSANSLTISKYTSMIGKDINGVNYTFATVTANTAFKNNGVFYFPNVYVKQGEAMSRQFPMLANNTTRSFEIPSANVDLTTMTVTVQESASNTQITEYFLAEDLTEIKSNSTIYFVEENENLNYTIKFGDNVIGKRPANGNIITVSYLDTVGSAANSIYTFRFSESVGGFFKNNVQVTTVASSYGGTDKETIEEVQFRAPYAYTAQNRAVTKSDYEVLISKDFNNVEAVSVWGGEDNDPVVYGKVFVSIKTKGYYTLSQLDKERIKRDLIKSRSVVTVTPEIVDPDFVYILARGKATFNPNLTTKTNEELKVAVRNSVIAYDNAELNRFNSTFRKSKLQNYVDECDPSITGSDIDIFLQKQVDIYPNETKNYDIKFNAPLTKGSFNNKLYSFPEMTVFDGNGIQRKVVIEEVPLTFNGIASIQMTDVGYGYTSVPNVIITGDGSGASATAKIVNGKVTEINIINKGHDYTQATVAILGGGGTGATAVARVDSDFANLRSYYYKDSGEKVVVDDNVGTIDYINGKITLESFKALNVVPNEYYANNVVTFNVLPENEIITPLRNRILTLNPYDAKSIVVEIVKD